MKSIHDMMGVVAQILMGNKCVVTFTVEGKSQSGLLIGDRLMYNASRITVPLSDLVKIGSKLRFSCHEFGSKDEHEFGWYITNAWLLDDTTCVGRTPGVFLGLYNCAGKIQQLEKRVGVLIYIDHEEREHHVMFLASKIWFFGKRSNAKKELKDILSIDDAMLFDAVPCAPEGNDFGCSWFATIMWKGSRPEVEYDSTVISQQNAPEDINILYKMLAINPKSLFVRLNGQVLKILNKEYGIALMQVQKNRYDTVLFHRSACFLFKLCLATHDLEEVFKEGDRLKIIAAPATKSLICQWAAAQVTVDTD